ncbi:hypothetical protein [Candidatus Cetobacterium colombiensis]|uniref:DUF2147 domain-containing protein n=1 Tax=Candidatus Cetobacterium colombiensis TaxID=3073100 RepID=A0ABU4W7J5_9FUSO|nr:hypothetical protein [Candidatus Cetobacterium colombiensis]MDX8335209.1 hypothetical protein [Candidatus Cetobacterium colombiensis]
MKLIYVILMVIFSINIYSQKESSPSIMLQKVAGKWTGIDENDLTVIISKSEENPTMYNIEFINVNKSGRTGEFQGEVIYTNQKSFLVDKDGKKLGFFNNDYFVKSLSNQIVGSLKFVNDMLYFEDFTDLCDIDSTCGLGVTLSSGYLKRL